MSGPPTQEGYPTNWKEIAKSVKERDGYMCRVCGCDGGERILLVHHIDHVKSHNKRTNLVTLCSTCHAAIHLAGYIPDPYDDFRHPWG